MRFTKLGVAAFLNANIALAADGYVLRHEFEGGWWDFDMASVVQVDDAIRKSQMTLSLSKPLQDQPTGSRYDKVVFTYEHDCKGNRLRVIDNVSYLTGERVNMSRASSHWRPAADSFAQKYACAMQKKEEGGG